MKKSYAETISSSRVMSSGMQNNEDEASRRGWDTTKTAGLDAARMAAIGLNDEQERLKADLKMKTAELDAKLAEINTLMSEATKVVKLGFPQAQWKEFGITAKR